jgi:hypothetical protein
MFDSLQGQEIFLLSTASGSAAHPTSYSMDTGSSFTGSKAAEGVKLTALTSI